MGEWAHIPPIGNNANWRSSSLHAIKLCINSDRSSIIDTLFQESFCVATCPTLKLQRQNLIIRKIVDSQIKLIHINKKQKAQKIRHVGRLIVRLLNETNYIIDQAPSYVWGITNIIYCDETMNLSHSISLLVLLYPSSTIG